MPLSYVVQIFYIWAVFDLIQFGALIQQNIEDIEQIKQVLDSCWDVISQELINDAIDQWSKRLFVFFCRVDTLSITSLILYCML